MAGGTKAERHSLLRRSAPRYLRYRAKLGFSRQGVRRGGDQCQRTGEEDRAHVPKPHRRVMTVVIQSFDPEQPGKSDRFRKRPGEPMGCLQNDQEVAW